MSDFFVIPDLQISHVPQYTHDFQLIETSNPNILNQTPDFIYRQLITELSHCRIVTLSHCHIVKFHIHHFIQHIASILKHPVEIVFFIVVEML